MLLDHKKSVLTIIDAQEKLMPAIDNGERVIENCAKLVTAARELGVPTLMAEQYPKGLGSIVAPISEAAGGSAAVAAKTCFSAFKDEGFKALVTAAAKPGEAQVIVCGAEAHVCVLQTAADLKAAGYDVFVVADGIGSRVPASHKLACERMAAMGITLVTTEMVLFEWIGDAGSAAFKALRPLIA